ncbi:MAG: GGDEF domain-containing protein [Anaerolineales bacterium]
MNFGRRRKTPAHLTEAEARRLVKPAGASIFLLALFLIGDGIYQNIAGDTSGYRSIVFGGTFFLMNIAFYFIALTNPASVTQHQNRFAVLDGIIFGAGLWIVPDKNIFAVYAILLLIALIFVLLWEKTAAFIFILTSIGISILLLYTEQNLTQPLLWERANFTLMSLILVESVSRLTRTMRARINRLETINEFARKIATSIEADEVIKVVNEALQKALQADSYYLGIFEQGQLSLPLFYDDGEYFINQEVPIEGTLSGWVIEHQQPLLMPDLRKKTDLEGVSLVIVGKERTSLSWMGVPMITTHIKGILAVASYRPNAFSRTDMELLENLGQQAALALDNAYHHKKVEKQARLDSLTQVYNHGYFLQHLEQEAENCKASNTSMSLIMLDIDHFKQYNDNYGHLTGDQVLIQITQIIASHIKTSDAVGRWGGEEFCVLLPQTTGEQAGQIAQRIQKKVNTMMLSGQDGSQLPLPTISQGIALYPDEKDQVMELVDLADKRLYTAKERGRNQIEPPPHHWQKLHET